ncbi:dihydrofolate reductase family protein [Palleronia sp. KMU-117]|uniref:dihydrofolate reductase family protein n=1 Tax=Palleronia sp. KMU-117 TaxID=3434108 RepID=UPI003D718E7B
MMRPAFTLTVVTSRDGFIARAPDDTPASWASPEEQALFLADVGAADWAVMGRHTHEGADRPDRRRIVFSAAAGAGHWRRPTQLWIDPAGLSPAELPGLVASVHPLRQGLILGGTQVHDWFLDHGAIDRVHLSVEPLEFGAGLALFSRFPGPPEAALAKAGFVKRSERRLNDRPTLYSVWTPRRG